MGLRRTPIFKVAVIVNQITFNELNMKGGFKKRLVEQGQELFIEEAIKEAIEMAKDDVNWGETHNRRKVIEWAERWGLDPEEIELELRRTFQKVWKNFRKNDDSFLPFI